MEDHNIDTVISHIDMGYLATLQGLPADDARRTSHGSFIPCFTQHRTTEGPVRCPCHVAGRRLIQGTRVGVLLATSQDGTSLKERGSNGGSARHRVELNPRNDSRMLLATSHGVA
jgi:hypothetical protein